jgi:DoxX-like family
MDIRALTYRITTAVTAVVLLSGGLADLLGAEWAVAGVMALGYPAYVVTLLGVWKVLGAVAVTVPGYPRLKEWAYAGIVFDLSGVAVSHLASGSPAFHVVVTTTLLVVAGLSWATRPASRRLVAPSERREPVAEPAPVA